jgi:hypothetical protein
MTRLRAIARVCIYAASAIAAAFAPNVPGAIALVGPSHASTDLGASLDPAARTIGWLSSFVADAFAHAGFAGLAFATALTIAATFALVEIRARRSASAPFALAAVVLCAACSLDAVHVGGGAADGLFLAALLLALERGGTGGLGATALVALLWANASPAGLLAPVFACAYALGDYLDARAEGAAQAAARSARGSLARTLVAIAATCATPALLAYPLDAWRALSLDSSLNDLLPAVPSVAAPLGYRVGVVATMIVAFAIGARSARAGATCAFAIAAILAFAKGAFVPMIAIAGAPILAEATSAIFARANRGTMGGATPGRALAGFALVAFGTALASGLVAARRFPSLASALDVAPFGVLAKYARDPGPHRRIICTKLPWCDVAERRYGLAVFADTRIANASDAIVASQRAIASATGDWSATARKHEIGAIFLDRRSGLVRVLAARGWHAFAADGSGALWLREGAP